MLRYGVYPEYSVEQLVRYVAYVDTAGTPVAWLTNGAMMVELYAPSGHLFYPLGSGTAANGQDWESYADSLGSASGPLARLDSAIGVVQEDLGVSVRRYRVSVMIPYPDPQIDSTAFRGVTFNLQSPDGRIALARAYLNDVLRLLPKDRFYRLALDGFVWLREDIPAGDTAVVIGVAREIHRAGLRFLWVPYFHQSAGRWKDWGFDAAWLQPNFFFHPEVSIARMDSALTLARAVGMGVEMEFNGRLLDSLPFQDRLDPYLAALANAPDLHARGTVLYEGAGALITLSTTRVPRLRALYERLAAVLRASPPRR